MASYVDVVVDGRTLKYCQLDDGSLCPVHVATSLDGGTLVLLPPDQVDALRTIEFPAEYPLPASQIAVLRAVSVENFPSGFAVSNFPSGFEATNLPPTYPLPADQEGILANIRTTVQDFTKGSGTPDATTLRVTEARRSPSTFTLNSRDITDTASTIAAVSPSRLSLEIFHHAGTDVFLCWGANDPTSALYSLRLSQGDYYRMGINDAVREVRAICASGNTATLNVTEGI